MDTRDLITRRDELKEQILEDFLKTFEHYVDRTETFEDIRFEEEELENFVGYWHFDIQEIKDIDELEGEVGIDNFEFGVYLIEEYYFEEYVEEDLIDCGYISRDFPTWIEIDWEATANNVRQDYSEVEFRGTTYLYRA